MQEIRVGWASTIPRQPWQASGISYEPKTTQFTTISQLLEAISQENINYLTVDPDWFTEARWISPLIQAAHSRHIQVILLTRHVGTRAFRLHEIDLASLLNPPSTQASCTVVNLTERTAWHHDVPLRVPTRQMELLFLLLENPLTVLTPEQINHFAQRSGWRHWSEESLKSTIYHLRSKIGAAHILTVRGVGYQFVSCGTRTTVHETEQD